jgi:hypothetical protein
MICGGAPGDGGVRVSKGVPGIGREGCDEARDMGRGEPIVFVQEADIIRPRGLEPAIGRLRPRQPCFRPQDPGPRREQRGVGREFRIGDDEDGLERLVRLAVQRRHRPRQMAMADGAHDDRYGWAGIGWHGTCACKWGIICERFFWSKFLEICPVAL